MAHRDDPKEIINVNVGGKRYTVRRGDLIVDSGSKLAEWFKPGVVKPIPMDRAGKVVFSSFHPTAHSSSHML